MVWFDFIILGVIILSALVSILRGFVREALSLAAWILSVLGALRLSPEVVPLLRSFVDSETLATVLAFVISFIVLFVVLSILNMFLVRLLRVSALKGADRSLGALFGLVRGALVVAVAVMFAELTAAPQTVWWRQSTLVPYFQTVSQQLRGWMPQGYNQSKLKFSTLGELVD